MAMPALFSPQQTAELLGISRSQVYIEMDQGRLPFIHIGKLRKTRLADLLEYVWSRPQ